MFKKGQSGNPNGCPKDKAHGGRHTEKFRIAAQKCFSKIGGWNEVENLYRQAHGMEKIKILEIIIDRGFGKAIQQIESESIGELARTLLIFPKT